MLVLNTLRYADEIRSMDEFELPEDTKASAREVDMALRLVKEMSEKWALLKRSVEKEGGKPPARTTRVRSARGVRKSSKAAAAHRHRAEPAERRKRA